MNAFKSSLMAGHLTSASSITDLFAATSKQVLVRDDVVFAPPTSNTYQAVIEANKRLKAGLNLFDNNMQYQKEVCIVDL